VRERGGPPSDRFGRLDDRVAVVTGSGSGIGRAVSVELATAGAHVVATSRTESRAEETARICGPRCEAIRFDVTDSVERGALVDRLARGHGHLDVLVANAGVDLSHEPGVSEISDEEWDTVLETNLSSVFRLVRAVLPLMRPGASIVTVGSAASLVARAGAAAYVASKGGLLQLTRALAVDLAPQGIRANCVCPGNIQTPLTDSFLAAASDPDALRAAYAGDAPMNRLGTPAEVAACVRFLASSDAAFVTGAVLAVDGGMTVI
jgi:NAD(P)-dependent dehydrogenase (short-subunit alcohol dehydrogenase family)